MKRHNVDTYDLMGLFLLRLRHKVAGLDKCKNSILTLACHAEVISCIWNKI